MAVRFDASGDYYSLTIPNTSGAWTWMFWAMKVVDQDGRHNTMLSLGNGLELDWDDRDATNLIFVFHNSYSSNSAGQAQSTWTHVALTHANASSVSKIYVNGALAVTHTGTTFNETTVQLGAWSGSQLFNGRFAAIKYFVVELAAADILQEMHTIVPRTASAGGFWPVFPGASERLLDYSGNGRNWTANGTLTDEDPPPVSWGAPVWIVPFTAAAGGSTTLVVQDALHAHSGDNVALTQKHLLAVADALHAHSVDNVALTQKHLLAAADTLHAHSAESPALTQKYLLALADALHSHATDAVALLQEHLLAIADTLHAHTADNAALTQKYLIATADALHAHSAENITLAAGLTLAVADALHAHSVESPALTQKHLLAVADALHAHSVDDVALAVGGALIVHDVIHAHTADNAALTQAHALAVQDALHAHAVAALTLGVALVLADALHGHTADNVVLTQAFLLSVADALHAHNAENIAFGPSTAVTVYADVAITPIATSEVAMAFVAAMTAKMAFSHIASVEM